MQRIGTPDGLFNGGDPATNTKGTVVTAEWLNTQQEEMVGVVEGLGGTLNPLDNGQVFDWLIASFAMLTGSASQLFRAAPAVGASDVVPLAQVQSLISAISQMVIASTAEAQAMTDNTKALTPLRLKEALQGANQSRAANGYQKLPGGLIFQWGITTSSATLNTVSTLPIAFPSAFVAGLSAGPDANTPYITGANPAGLADINIGAWDHAGGRVSTPVRWAAIGY